MLNSHSRTRGPTAEVERAYRRGFMHGAHAAVESLKAGASADDVDNWVRCDIAAWRFEVTGIPDTAMVEIVPPPDEPGNTDVL